jgi:hypothetical protein
VKSSTTQLIATLTCLWFATGAGAQQIINPPDPTPDPALLAMGLGLCMNIRELRGQGATACRQYTQLSGRADKAMADWEARNGADVPRITQQCEVNFRTYLKNPGDFERKKREVKDMLEAKLAAEHPDRAACDKRLAAIEAENLSKVFPLPEAPEPAAPAKAKK